MTAPYEEAGRAPSWPGLLRRLLNEALTENEIRELALDHYPEVYDTFSEAMSRTSLIDRLVGWCYRHHCLAELGEEVRARNADVWKRYAARLEAAARQPSRPPGHRQPRNLRLGSFHALPSAPMFVGRARELETLETFWSKSEHGIVCLIGLGGAGKTALVSEFLRRLLKGGSPQPSGVFVWSFYENADAQQFLEAAYGYFSGGRRSRGGGTGTFFLLTELLNELSGSERHLIVMDGLERAQHGPDSSTDGFGELVDPLLSQVVGRLAAGLGSTKAIITSRFPVPKISPWLGSTAQTIDVDQLEPADARALLRRHGVQGDDAVLDHVIAVFGSHALTLDHLGGYLRRFSKGNATAVRALPEPEVGSGEPQERQLARVLHAYEQALPARELAVLQRLSVFRHSMGAAELHRMFSMGPKPSITGPLQGLSLSDFESLLDRLTQLHLVLLARRQGYTIHPAVRDHFFRSFTDSPAVLQAVRRHYASLAGPPGSALPRERKALDVLEELIHHTLQLGRISDATEIWFQRLGGFTHLAWELGQYSRCIRILNDFPVCPDSAGLVWCYRALGDLDTATKLVEPDDAWWLGMLGCLRGRLRETAELLSDRRHDAIRVICEFLTGQVGAEALDAAPAWAGLPVTVADCCLAADMVEKAREQLATFGSETPKGQWSDEASRHDLLAAELARRDGDHVQSRSLLAKAEQWTVQSGSQEHLSLLHLGRARLAIDERRFETAEAVIREGLHIVEQCGFGLYHIELLIERARLELATDRAGQAASSARAARNGLTRAEREPPEVPDLDEHALVLLGADHPKVGFVWASARASRLLAQAQREQATPTP